MASVAVETTADTSATTSAVQSPLAQAPPPIPPPRSFLNRNTETEKSFSEVSKSNLLFDSFTMASKAETPTAAPSQPNISSSTPSPPPPPADFQSITSPLPPDLPPPPDFYMSSSSPPPPPPPPSYLFPELSSGDLPPPPPPQVLMHMEPQPRPTYICSYDPPSPEIKSEYDPKLPPGFSSESTQNPFSPPPPPVPPPPRPTPPPPPTPPVRRASKENIDTPPHSTSEDNYSLSSQTYTNISSSVLYLASAEDTQTKDSIDGTSCNYPAKNVTTDTQMTTEDSLDGRPTSSGLSSSTLSATLLLTPESGLSPLPPHALRVSPVPTDANTISSSSRMTDDITGTSVSSDATSTPNIFDSRDTTFDIDTPEVTPQLSEIIETPSPTPNEVKMNSIMDEIIADKASASEITPQLSEISRPYSATPTDEKINSVNLENAADAEVDKSAKRVMKQNMTLEISTISPPDSSESERFEDTTGNDSISEYTDYSLTERRDGDTVTGSLTVTSNTEAAQMSSPFSTEPPSLFSLPTDSDTISADMDSLAADTLSPMGDFESYSADVDTSTIDSISTTRAVDMFLTSSSVFSESAYATADSNMESATMSPAFTESCTITPNPDFITPMSTNPTTTPVPSPIPSSPLPYFDAIPPDSMQLSQFHTSSINPSLCAMVTSTSRMIVSALEHRSEFQSKPSSIQKRLVSSQLSDSLLQDDKIVSPLTLSDVSQQTSTENDDKTCKQNINSSSDADKLEEKLLGEKQNTGTEKSEKEADIASTDDIKSILQDERKAFQEEHDHVYVDAKHIEQTASSEKEKKTSEEGESRVLISADDRFSIENKHVKSYSTNNFSQNEKESTHDKHQIREVPEDNSGETLIELQTNEKADKDMEENIIICPREPASTTYEMELAVHETRHTKPEVAQNERPYKENYLGKQAVKENEIDILEETSAIDIMQTDNSQNKENISTETVKGVKDENCNDSKKLDDKDVFDDSEHILICKELTNDGNLEIQSKETKQEDDKIEEKEPHNLSHSPLLIFDFTSDGHPSPSDAVSKLPSKSPSIVKLKSYPSSPSSSSPPKHAISTRFSSCGGSMSPKSPVSPARSPLSKGTDIPTSPKGQRNIPLSKSPEEAMELLDVMVGNMETLSADLLHSPVIKEVTEEMITTSETSLNDKTNHVSSESEPENLKSSTLEHKSPEPKDTPSEVCKDKEMTTKEKITTSETSLNDKTNNESFKSEPEVLKSNTSEHKSPEPKDTPSDVCKDKVMATKEKITTSETYLNDKTNNESFKSEPEVLKSNTSEHKSPEPKDTPSDVCKDKEMTTKEIINTSETYLNDKTNNESSKSEPKDPKSNTSEYDPQKPKDTLTDVCRDKDKDSSHSNTISDEANGVTADSVFSSSSPTSPCSSHPENTTHTPYHSLSLSLDGKEDSQFDVKDSAIDQHSPLHIDPCDSVEPNVLSTCPPSDELMPSHNSQALHATNIKTNENLIDVAITSSELINGSKVADKNEKDIMPSKTLLSTENETKEDKDFESCNMDHSESHTCLENTETECTHANNLDSQKDSLDHISDIEKVLAVASNDSPTSFSSPSLHSIVEDVVLPTSASRAKTPPLPPPRSCVNTPRPGMGGAPLPPPRQYMLIPINSSQPPSRRHSPPPAPPRSTSVRRSPPPPPPRSAIQTPVAKPEWIDFPPLPPPPISAINTPSTPPKLTPVPEESSFPTTPIPPKESQNEFSPVRSISQSHGQSSIQTISESNCDSTHRPEFDSVDEEDPHRSQSQPTAESSSLTCTSNSPPALPPMPEEDNEEEPPPPPPPPIDFRDEHLPPLPLPPPPESLISPPPPPARSRRLTPPLPPPPVFSNEGLDKDNSPPPSKDKSETNTGSLLLASDMATGSSDASAVSLPGTSSENDTPGGAPMTHAPALASSAPVVPPPPPPPLMPAVSRSSLPSSSQIPSHPPLSVPPLPRCPAPPSSRQTPNSALWTVSPYGKVVINRNDIPLPSPEEEIRKTFHNVKNWGLLEYNMDTLAVYTQLRPNIQMGPQCGLVALSMASQVFPETKEIEEILQEAKELKFTSHGEMFSSENMAKLASGINGMEAVVRRDVLCNPKTLLELLIHGNLILAPYDSDQNHMPNLRNGHKAHWGIVCGCLVQSHSLSMYMGGASKLDSRVDNLWHMRPRSRRGIAPSRDGSVTPSTPLIPGSPRLGHRILKTPEVPILSTSDGMKTPESPLTGRTSEMDTWSICSSRVNTPMLPEILNDDLRMVLLWRQGKSRNLIAALAEKLCESNDQLFEYPSPTNEVESEFIIGSVQDGLAGQVVVLHKTKTALSDLVGILQDKEN